MSGPVLSYTLGKICGVHAITLTPSATDMRAIFKDVSRSDEPSSIPGIIWQCRSNNDVTLCIVGRQQPAPRFHLPWLRQCRPDDDIPLLRILLCKGSEAQSRKITLPADGLGNCHAATNNNQVMPAD